MPRPARPEFDQLALFDGEVAKRRGSFGVSVGGGRRRRSRSYNDALHPRDAYGRFTSKAGRGRRRSDDDNDGDGRQQARRRPRRPSGVGRKLLGAAVAAGGAAALAGVASANRGRPQWKPSGTRLEVAASLPRGLRPKLSVGVRSSERPGRTTIFSGERTGRLQASLRERSLTYTPPKLDASQREAIRNLQARGQARLGAARSRVQDARRRLRRPTPTPQFLGELPSGERGSRTRPKRFIDQQPLASRRSEPLPQRRDRKPVRPDEVIRTGPRSMRGEATITAQRLSGRQLPRAGRTLTPTSGASFELEAGPRRPKRPVLDLQQGGDGTYRATRIKRPVKPDYLDDDEWKSLSRVDRAVLGGGTFTNPPEPRTRPKKTALYSNATAAARADTEIGQVAGTPTARKRMSALRAKVRKEAGRTASDTEGTLDRWGVSKITSPPRAVRETDALGRLRMTRRGAGGEWDWFDSLPRQEQQRLRRNGWLSGNVRLGVDEASDLIRRNSGRDAGHDDAMREWVRMTRVVDGARALAAGRPPKYVDHAELSPTLAKDHELSADRLFSRDGTRHVVEVAWWRDLEDRRRRYANTTSRRVRKRRRPTRSKKVARVMREFKAGELHSGSKTGPKVTSRKQAVAIALSEARRARRKRVRKRLEPVVKHPGHADQSVHGRRHGGRGSRRPIGTRRAGRGGRREQLHDPKGRFTTTATRRASRRARRASVVGGTLAAATITGLAAGRMVGNVRATRPTRPLDLREAVRTQPYTPRLPDHAGVN